MNTGPAFGGPANGRTLKGEADLLDFVTVSLRGREMRRTTTHTVYEWQCRKINGDRGPVDVGFWVARGVPPEEISKCMFNHSTP